MEILYVVCTCTFGIATYNLEVVAEITLSGIGSPSDVVTTKVNNREGQASGKPKPVKAIEPPSSEPVNVLTVNDVFSFRGNELVSPTGSSLTLTQY